MRALPRPFRGLCRAGRERSLTCGWAPGSTSRTGCTQKTSCRPSSSSSFRCRTNKTDYCIRRCLPPLTYHLLPLPRYAVHPPPPLFLSPPPRGLHLPLSWLSRRWTTEGKRRCMRNGNFITRGGGSKWLRHSLQSERGRERAVKEREREGERERRRAAAQPAHSETNPPFPLGLPHARDPASSLQIPATRSAFSRLLHTKNGQKTAKGCWTMEALLVKLHCVPC